MPNQQPARTHPEGLYDTKERTIHVLVLDRLTQQRAVHASAASRPSKEVHEGPVCLSLTRVLQ